MTIHNCYPAASGYSVHPIRYSQGDIKSLPIPTQIYGTPSLSPDGKRLLLLQPEHDDSNKREINVVLNWFEELKHLVPISNQ